MAPPPVQRRLNSPDPERPNFQHSSSCVFQDIKGSPLTPCSEPHHRHCTRERNSPQPRTLPATRQTIDTFLTTEPKMCIPCSTKQKGEPSLRLPALGVLLPMRTAGRTASDSAACRQPASLVLAHDGVNACQHLRRQLGDHRHRRHVVLHLWRRRMPVLLGSCLHQHGQHMPATPILPVVGQLLVQPHTWLSRKAGQPHWSASNCFLATAAGGRRHNGNRQCGAETTAGPPAPRASPP